MKNTLPAWLVALALVPGASLANGITGVTYEGSGCPAGSVGRSTSNDGSRTTLIFDNFVASQGPNIPESEEVKACRVTFSLEGPEGVEVEATTRGYVQLPAATTARQQQHIISVKQGNNVTRFNGPINKDYLTRTQGTLRDRNSASFTIQLQLELDGIGQAQTTIDSIDVVVGTP